MRTNPALSPQHVANVEEVNRLLSLAYGYYDLGHFDKAEALEQERQRLQAILDEEKMKLVKLEQAVKVLEKHKEKQKEAYIEEQKAIELRQFSEIGVQRFFLQNREKEEEEDAELKKLLEDSELEYME